MRQDPTAADELSQSRLPIAAAFLPRLKLGAGMMIVLIAALTSTLAQAQAQDAVRPTNRAEAPAVRDVRPYAVPAIEGAF